MAIVTYTSVNRFMFEIWTATALQMGYNRTEAEARAWFLMRNNVSPLLRNRELLIRTIPDHAIQRD